MERDPYKLWEVLGTWAAAVATFAAVIVSLRLARRAERPQLRIRADLRLLLDPAKVADPENVRRDQLPEMIFLDMANVGLTTARITSVGWHWYWIRSTGALQNPPEHFMRSHPWPTVLEHSDQLQWLLKPEDVLCLAAPMLAGTWWWRLKLQLLCVIVGTSTGDSFRGRLGPSLREAFANETAKIRAARRLSQA
jgi:hypothetical protein